MGANLDLSLTASRDPQAGLRAARRETMLELIQVGSGVALVAFMWTHVMLVSSVLLGASTMDRIAHLMEVTWGAYLVPPAVTVLFLAHAVLAARKIPFRLDERLAGIERTAAFRHHDSLTWWIQVVTGMTIFALGLTHIWVVVTTYPILAAKSAVRVHGPYLWFYIPLLIGVELHASVGLYRAMIKWGWVPREAMRRAEILMTAFFLALGSVTLAALWKLGGPG